MGIARRIAAYVALSGLEALYYVASVLKIGDPDRLAMYMKCMQASDLGAIEYAAPRNGMRAAS